LFVDFEAEVVVLDAVHDGAGGDGELQRVLALPEE
jgi:hypothetical protein